METVLENSTAQVSIYLAFHDVKMCHKFGLM